MALILRIVIRELRGGFRDFRLFLACLIIGTSVIAAVGSLSASVSQSILRDAKTLLGGDISLTSANQPFTGEQRAFLKKWGRTSETTDMRAMASFGPAITLIELKGVDDAYPLLGDLTTASGERASLVPGSVLVADALLQRLSVKVGQNLTLGKSSFVIAGVIGKEPDSISGSFGLGPRVIARLDDLQKAGLLGPEELVHYHERLLLTRSNDLPAFETALKKSLPVASWTVHNFHDANQGTARFVSRLQLLLTLAGLGTLLIGGVGISNATQAYMLRKIHAIAIMKALGARQNSIFAIYAVLLSVMALLGTFLGAVLGALGAWLILPHLANYFPVESGDVIHLPALLESIWFGFLTVVVFVVTLLGRSVSVRAASLFRSASVPVLGVASRRWIFLNLALAILLIVSLITTAADHKIASGFVVASGVTLLLLMAASRVVKILSRLVHCRAPWARLAAANLDSPGAPTLSIMLSIGIGLTVLIALLVVEGNFRREISDTLPATAPSLFFTDIQPDEREGFTNFMQSQPAVHDLTLSPMIRGRIATLNGVPVEQIRVNDDAKWALESDRGLSFSAAPPKGNPIVNGTWWSADYDGPTLVSLDRKLAKGMGLKIGDHIGLTILGAPLEATIANLRDVNYMTLQINFSMILSPGPIENFPATYLATAQIDGGPAPELELIRTLTARFPNISSITIRDQLKTMADIVDHIATAIRFIVLITLLSGFIVLASSMVSTLERRAYTLTLFKVLGATQRDIVLSFGAEWLALAFITFVMSAVLGTAGGWLILYSMDWAHFIFLPKVIAETCAITLAVIVVTGCIVHRHVFAQQSLSFLRND